MFRITEVKVKLADDWETEVQRIRAYVTLTIDDCFVIRELKVIEGKRGVFVCMPHRKLTDHCAECRAKNFLQARFCWYCGVNLPTDRAERDEFGRVMLHADVAHPITNACRHMIQDAVLAAYRAEIDRNQEGSQ